MAADGSVIIDVLLDDDSVTSGMDNINGQVGKLKGVAKTVAKGLAVVGAAATAAFVGFSKSAIVAAANAQAMNAQFDTVFKEVGTSATDGLNRIAEETGIVATRLKGSFTQMAAFAKTTGMDTADALSLTERATLAAADSAAFYDKSIESTAESLQSFLKGNFENDAALGISATETTRNAKANELYGKSFIKLSESQKQLTLLAMVEDGNKLSGALGQAARESDGLENLLGNLKAAWTELMVKFGTPILPIVTSWLNKIAKAIQNFDATPFIAAFSFIWDALNKFASQAVGIYETIKTSISGSGGLLAALGIDEAFIANVQGYLATAKEVFTVAFNGIMAVVQNAFGFIQTYIVPILSQIVSFIGSQLAVIQQFWTENGTQIVQAVTNAFNIVKSVIDFIMPAVLFVIDFIWTAIKQVITGALNVIMGLIKVFSGLFTGDFGKMWEGIKQIFFGAIDLIIGWMSLTFVGGLRTLLANFGKAGFNILKSMWDDIAKVFKNMGSSVSGVVSKMATSIVNYFTGILTRAQGIFSTLRTFGANIWNAIRSTISNIAQKIWSDVVTKFTGLVSSIKNIFGTVQSVISGIWSKVMSYFNGINLKQVGINIIQGLINGIGSMGSKIKEKAEEIARSLPEWMKKVLGIHSPSRVMAEIGKFVGQGLTNGIAATKTAVSKVMNQLSQVIIGTSKTNANEVAKINRTAASEQAEIEKKSAKSIAEIHAKAKDVKRKLTAAEVRKIQKLESDADAKIVENKKKHSASLAKIQSGSQKERLDAIKQFADDKKSLEQSSLIDEVNIWRKASESFKAGTKEKIDAQKLYRDSLDAVNKEITSINETYANKMQVINDKLIAGEKELNDAYTSAFSNRVNSIVSLAGLFDQFSANIETTGDVLLSNLQSQVTGLIDWRSTLDSLWGRIGDQGLLEELEAMGPKALGELQALNSMTNEQLAQYSSLYQQKAELARLQAEEELAGMKEDTALRIAELRATANIELDVLRREWTARIQSVTKATSTELLTLKKIGKDAGQGLLDGLTSMEGPLVTKATAIAQAIKKAIAGALDIHSPSRWMRDFVAGNMATGWIKGIDKSQNAILNKASQLGEWMKPDISSGFVNKLRGVSAPVGNIMPTSSVQGNSVSNTTNHSKTISPNIINHFTPAESTPSEHARKQRQLLQRYAMEF